MKFGLLLISMLMTVSAFSSDKGNGGSGTESQLAGQQAQLELIGSKIRMFFLQNESMQDVFPEFEIKTLTKKIKITEIEIVNDDELIDKHGKSRTCLNFPDQSLIRCKYSGIETLMNEPTALFVLMFHEYLGLIGAEETSPANPATIDGYSISKRLAPYINSQASIVNSFDLDINYPSVAETSVKWKNRMFPTATIYNTSWSLVPKNTKKIKVQIDTTGAVLNNVSYEIYVREALGGESTLFSKGIFVSPSLETNIAFIPFEEGKIYSLKITGWATLATLSLFWTENLHTERIRLTTENDEVIFDSEALPFPLDEKDFYASLNQMDVDFDINFR
jgi:hypothetical protein